LKRERKHKETKQKKKHYKNKEEIIKKREDKKEEAVYVTCFACFLFTLSRRLMDHGFTAQKKVVTIQDSTQG